MHFFLFKPHHFFSFSQVTSISNSSLNHHMDSIIWSRLPQRLLDRVLASLPPPAFFRSRAVCKRWYFLLFSTAFLELYLEASPHHYPWFIFFKQQPHNNQVFKKITTNNVNNPISAKYHCYLFDPKNLKWYKLTFPSMPTGFSPVSSSGGLICWVSQESGPKNILFHNPLIMGSLFQLPSTLRPRLRPSIGVKVTNSSIDLALAGDDMISPYAVKNLTSENFHVDNGGFYSIWGRTAALPRLCSLESSRMVNVDESFYCMDYSPFSVLCYDISMNQWSKIQAPMRRFLRSPSLVKCKGKLMLVGAVEKSKLNIPKSLRIWLFDERRALWDEIERMPQELYVEFEKMEGEMGFYCVANGEFVLLVINGSPDTMIVFDIERGRWMWVPPCPYLSRGDELNGFEYEPRLAVPMSGLLEQLNLSLNSTT